MQLYVNDTEQIQISDVLAVAKPQLKAVLVQGLSDINGYSCGLDVSITHNGGVRLWFSCPECKRRSGVLYRHPVTDQVACRLCLGVKYRRKK